MWRYLWELLSDWFRLDCKGVTAIEYALVAALIAIVIIVAVKAVGTDLTTIFTTIGTKLAGHHDD